MPRLISLHPGSPRFHPLFRGNCYQVPVHLSGDSLSTICTGVCARLHVCKHTHTHTSGSILMFAQHGITWRLLCTCVCNVILLQLRRLQCADVAGSFSCLGEWVPLRWMMKGGLPEMQTRSPSLGSPRGCVAPFIHHRCPWRACWVSVWFLSPLISGAASPQSSCPRRSRKNVPEDREGYRTVPHRLRGSIRFLLGLPLGAPWGCLDPQVSRPIMLFAGWRIPQKHFQDALEIGIS